MKQPCPQGLHQILHRLAFDLVVFRLSHQNGQRGQLAKVLQSQFVRVGQHPNVVGAGDQHFGVRDPRGQAGEPMQLTRDSPHHTGFHQKGVFVRLANGSLQFGDS